MTRNICCSFFSWVICDLHVLGTRCFTTKCFTAYRESVEEFLVFANLARNGDKTTLLPELYLLWISIMIAVMSTLTAMTSSSSAVVCSRIGTELLCTWSTPPLSPLILCVNFLVEKPLLGKFTVFPKMIIKWLMNLLKI